MNKNILIIDDEPEIADLIEIYLKNENYNVYKFYSPIDALECINSQAIDLAILDVMLLNIDGFMLYKKIREKYNYPIIMITAKDEEIDKITGLTLGADDYITKPFRPLEMIARVKAQLRRYTKYNENDITMATNRDILSISDLTLNINTHQCLLKEKEIILTPTEFSILQILCERQGTVVSSEQLFKEIWKDEYYNKSNNTITVHIRHLREKMNDTFEEPKYIKTIWGVGYKIG